ncbi:hypothetical protein [Pseudomonas syringae]|uniref:hypothetical protein n=1 Tax=Pseudomonas syringae TaxID=317 RepID=UPI00200FCF99|nr:hypothetical protein [Pseudomonas syringae]
MQQHCGAAIRLAAGRDVHVTHFQRLALGLETEFVQRMGVRETFQLLAITGRLSQCYA